MTDPTKAYNSLHELAIKLQQQTQVLVDLVDATKEETAARDRKVHAIEEQTKSIRTQTRFSIVLLALVLITTFGVASLAYQNNKDAEKRSTTATKQRLEQLERQKRLEKFIIVSSRCDVENDIPENYEKCLKEGGIDE